MAFQSETRVLFVELSDRFPFANWSLKNRSIPVTNDKPLNSMYLNCHKSPTNLLPSNRSLAFHSPGTPTKPIKIQLLSFPFCMFHTVVHRQRFQSECETILPHLQIKSFLAETKLQKLNFPRFFFRIIFITFFS